MSPRTTAFEIKLWLVPTGLSQMSERDDDSTSTNGYDMKIGVETLTT
jgi:hypothetical protein